LDDTHKSSADVGDLHRQFPRCLSLSGSTFRSDPVGTHAGALLLQTERATMQGEE